jgi:uncharacterized protein (DUF302 family)
MLPTLARAAAVCLVTTTSGFAAELVEKISPHSVSRTIDRLEAALEAAGATIFVRIDRAAGAASVDLDLAPSTLLVFGNPKLVTPAMQDSMTAGLDLPLRVLAYADAEGVVHVVYHAPAELAATHGLPEDAEYIQMMSEALDKLTSKAVASE